MCVVENMLAFMVYVVSVICLCFFMSENGRADLYVMICCCEITMYVMKVSKKKYMVENVNVHEKYGGEEKKLFGVLFVNEGENDE